MDIRTPHRPRLATRIVAAATLAGAASFVIAPDATYDAAYAILTLPDRINDFTVSAIREVNDRQDPPSPHTLG